MEKSPAAQSTRSASSLTEVHSHHHQEDAHLQSKMKTISTLDTARSGATALALGMGLAVLGTAGNTLRVYDTTRSDDPRDILSLWPANFNIKPTVALVVGSVFVVLASIVSLAFARVTSLRTKQTPAFSLGAPVIGLIASLIAIIFFYAVNASETTDTFASWTCRWKKVPMSQAPHWDTLCGQSYAGIYLAILLVPVEAAVLGLAVFQKKAERYTERYEGAKKSPAL
ncbi:hypothetical protein QBC35DRAFT_139147 [Podospora australis]|uniref:Uncharacterized protein n=1 Tax=Podospora australis TaxID=1536484 RepID=A0AAN6WWL3_9PEZI|nr:hypothetical protein QBC35DRAFT_139147 [Podospora australis]